MELVVRSIPWLSLILQCGVCKVSLPDATDRKFIGDCVKAHNEARSSVEPPARNMLRTTWDEGLAAAARDWAKNCNFQHSSRAGENIWAGYPPSNFAATDAIKSWADEKLHYDYNSNGCSKVCGHYTQVVWASSSKVGCAVQLCPNGVKTTKFDTEEGAIFVCNYAPAGNANGGRPYRTGGKPCAACDGICAENLCGDPRTAEWDHAEGSCGPSCVAVVAFRPLALICTFVAAYAVRRFYPDVFCYE